MAGAGPGGRVREGHSLAGSEGERRSGVRIYAMLALRCFEPTRMSLASLKGKVVVK